MGSTASFYLQERKKNQRLGSQSGFLSRLNLKPWTEKLMHSSPCRPLLQKKGLLITGNIPGFIFLFVFLLDLSWMTSTRAENSTVYVKSVFINCLIRASSFACHLKSGFVGWQSIRCTIPLLLLCLVSVDQCEGGIFGEREGARGSITLTLCAVCNLIWEAVISDRAAALTRYALPEWQIRLLQLDWRVYCSKSGASLITSGQCAFCICLIRLTCSEVCWLAL